MGNRRCVWIGAAAGAVAFAIGGTATLAAETDDAAFTVETIQYGVGDVAGADSTEIPLLLDLYRPAEASEGGNIPAVIMVHGGAFVTGARDITEQSSMGNGFAKRGMAAASISYRLLGDRPGPLSEWAASFAEMIAGLSHPVLGDMMEQYGNAWPAAVAAASEDTLAALNWLYENADQYGIDRDRIVLLGASAGSITVLNLAYALDGFDVPRPPVAAVVSVRGTLLDLPRPRPAIQAGEPPLFIVHGAADRRLPYAEAVRLYNLARAAEVPVELHPFADIGHAMRGPESLEIMTLADGTPLFDRIVAFLNAAFDDPAGLASRACMGDAPVYCPAD